MKCAQYRYESDRELDKRRPGSVRGFDPLVRRDLEKSEPPPADLTSSPTSILAFGGIPQGATVAMSDHVGASL